MKKIKIIAISLLVLVVGAVLVVMLAAHGDEIVSGVALADKPVSDIKTLDGILSSKGTSASGFDGKVYTASCVEFGKYVYTYVSPVPEDKALVANVQFITSPKGIEYKAQWSQGNTVVKEETKAIDSTTNREAVSYVLEEALVQKGTYTLAIYYKSKQLYSQQFTVD